jgi:hypothetical protein
MENNDKAKRILFGRTDIGDENFGIDNPESRLSGTEYFVDTANERVFKKTQDGITEISESKEAPPTIGNPSTDWDEIKRMASENKPLIPYSPPTDEEIINIKLNQKSLTLVLDYCNEIGLTPEQLIEDRKSLEDLKRQNKEWQEECERLAKLVEYWQTECYKLNPGFQRPKLDHL